MRLILLGPPGSGKGTVSEGLLRDDKLFHLSAGELLREEVAKNTTLGQEIKRYTEQGKLVPDEFVVQIVKLALSGKQNFVLDGFPRTVFQAKEIEDLHIDKVLYFEVAEDIVVERLSGRRVCERGVHTYHLVYLPPKNKGICDHDGTRLIQRKDDRPAVIRERFRVYDTLTKPLVEFYRKKKLLVRIDAAKKPDHVYEDVRVALKGK